MTFRQSEKEAIKSLIYAIVKSKDTAVGAVLEKSGSELQELNPEFFNRQHFSDLKSALRRVENGNESISDLNFSLPEMEGTFKVHVDTSGGKRNRKYLVSVVYPDDYQSSDEAPISPDDAEANRSISELRGRKNDYPEDRMHIAAHIALLVNMRCYSVSQRKVSAKSRDDNPDIVGSYLSGSMSHRNSLEWAGRSAPKVTHFIGAEVKTVLATEGAIYSAIREARHNTRYFDRGYLIAMIERKLRRFALRMAEEYDVGLIVVDESAPWRSQILHQCPIRSDLGQIHNFVSRHQVDSTFKVLQEIHTALSNGRGIEDDLRMALNVCLSDQELWSIVPRLPESIQADLKVACDLNDASAQDTMRAFTEIVFGLLIDAYDESEFDDFESFRNSFHLISRSQQTGLFDVSRLVKGLKNFREAWAEELSVKIKEIQF